MNEIVLRQRPKPPIWQRAATSMRALFAATRAGRPRHEPNRHTEAYARYRQFGSWGVGRSRPTIKPLPANLRFFSRTPHASRAIGIYSRAISQFDWHVAAKEGVTANAEIDRQIAVTQACFESPNNDDSLTTMIQQIVEDVCVGGAGVVEHATGGDPIRPLWMWPVDVLSIQIYPEWDGTDAQPRYCQAYGYGNAGVAQGRDLYNSELVYMRDRPTTDNPFSYGMLEIAFNTINRLLGVAEYAGNVAANAHPENLIFLEEADYTKIEAFRSYWRNDIEGQGQVPIVGGKSANVLKLRGSNDDALFLEYQTFIIRELAIAFHLSPQDFGVEADVNRNTAEVGWDRTWDLGLRPVTKMIAAYFTRETILGKLGFSQIELVPGGLDREDELNTATILKMRYEMNSITPAEIRAKFNEAPIPDSPWSNLTAADIDIAKEAARSAAVVDDPALPKPNKAPALPAPAKPPKGP